MIPFDEAAYKSCNEYEHDLGDDWQIYSDRTIWATDDGLRSRLAVGASAVYTRVWSEAPIIRVSIGRHGRNPVGRVDVVVWRKGKGLLIGHD